MSSVTELFVDARGLLRAKLRADDGEHVGCEVVQIRSADGESVRLRIVVATRCSRAHRFDRDGYGGQTASGRLSFERQFQRHIAIRGKLILGAQIECDRGRRKVRRIGQGNASSLADVTDRPR